MIIKLIAVFQSDLILVMPDNILLVLQTHRVDQLQVRHHHHLMLLKMSEMVNSYSDYLKCIQIILWQHQFWLNIMVASLSHWWHRETDSLSASHSHLWAIYHLTARLWTVAGRQSTRRTLRQIFVLLHCLWILKEGVWEELSWFDLMEFERCWHLRSRNGLENYLKFQHICVLWVPQLD